MESLFLLLFLLNFIFCLGSQDSDPRPRVTMALNNHPLLHGNAILKVDDILNITCSVSPASPQDLHFDWDFPNKASGSRVDYQTGIQSHTMILKNLQEHDSGEYKCSSSSNLDETYNLQTVLRVKVKQRKAAPCTEFLCGVDCVPRRHVCDGLKDCKNGDDEAERHCGHAPCLNKIRCGDGRCISSTWCCESKTTNCTTSPWLPCCAYSRGFPDDGGYIQETQRYKDVAFFQTTVYTVIGCAMAFMFIVTILVVAICRVHMRRTLMPRCGVGNRGVNCRAGGHFDNLPFYDLDVLFNRHNDVMSVNPLLVTYNINNGVQIVGRPVDPPPYCEIVATPPKEGPPPPYSSVENLSSSRRASRHELDETTSAEAEPREDDALLPQPEPPISVISSNQLESTSVYVVNLTESEQGGSPMLTVVETQVLPSTSSQDSQQTTTHHDSNKV